MSTVATLWVKLGLDSKGYKAGLDKAAKSAKDVGKSMMGIGAGLTAGVTLPIIAAGGAAVKFASDLEQSIGGVESVFGDAQDAIFEFGKTSADVVGLSKAQFNSLATVGGALLQNLGFSANDAAEETNILALRAADMAATFGGPVSGAMEAIQSALKGEFNPLEQFGVKMNQAAITARALELGLADLDGELDDNAKATAALSLLYEQTDKIAGQFARESNTLAGQMERVKAKFQDQAAVLGTQLLPLGVKLMQFISGLIDRFTALNPEQQKMILIIGGIVAAIGPLIMIIGGLITAFGTIATVAGAIFSPIGIAIVAIIAVIALLALAWKNNWGGIQEKVKEAWAVIQPVLATIWDWLATNIPQAIETLAAYWSDTLLPAIQAVWSWIDTNLVPLFEALAELLGATLGLAIEALSGIWENVLVPALKTAYEWFNDKILPVIKDVSDWLSNNFEPALDGIATAISKVVDWIKDFVKEIKSVKLPWWMTPGSPTPFETGLLGIADAMKKVNDEGLPSLSVGAMPNAIVAPVGNMSNQNMNDRALIEEIRRGNRELLIGLRDVVELATG